jgi:predicted Zn-dependent peptidase
VIVGDFNPNEGLQLVQKYFGDIPASDLPPRPDLSEPRQEKEKRFSKDDPLATRPALAFAYHMPERRTPEYFAMGLLDQMLLQGEDSDLYQALVQQKGITDDIDGGINALLGNMYNYNGPMLWMASLIYDPGYASDSILQAVDAQIEKYRQEQVAGEVLDRALIKLRSAFYDEMATYFGFGRADLLACFALFDDNPSLINDIEKEFRNITPALIRQTAQAYLRPANRTILTINPKASR